MEKIEIFNALIDIGCCNRCALRYIGDTIDFTDPDLYITKLFKLEYNGDVVNPTKKIKSNPCSICLDLINDAVLDDFVTSKELQKALEYDTATFTNYISFPTAVLIREYSVQVYLREKFPNFKDTDNIFPLNRAWSLSIQKKISAKLNKKFDKDSKLFIKFSTKYEQNDQESAVIYLIMKNLHRRTCELSRNMVNEALEKMDQNEFKKHSAVPPQIPTNSLVLESISCHHGAIYIAGRYLKVVRNIGQSPWLVDSEIPIESSVQEIIFEAIGDTFKSSGLVFSASGREDVDVRMLGRGRPFYVKVNDPKITKISPQQFRFIEKQVCSSGQVGVRWLQFVEMSNISKFKRGEEFKKKIYQALCIIKNSDMLQTYVDKINTLHHVTIQQKTPIRVFHRRSAATRTKEIYQINAEAVEGMGSKLFKLNLVTQAGTYVKEFIHGDLGRTTPSLGTLIGDWVDILALDVLDIDLDYPPPIADQ